MSTKFVFLLLPGVHLLDLAGADQALHEAIDFGADFQITYCGIDVAPVSSAGLHFKQQPHFSDIPLEAGDYLVIPGASISYLLSKDFRKQKELFSWIKKCHNNQVHLVSICAGAFVLAFAGLLDGRECTTHFKQTANLQALFPKAKVKEHVLFVESGSIFTSAGIAAGIDLVLYIIEKIRGSYFAHKVARELVIYNRREPDSSQVSVFMQFRNHIHAGIHTAQDFIINNIHQKHSLINLAELANMSERNFTRLFKKNTGTSVVSFINAVRKEMIQNLVKNKDLNYGQIAAKVGLGSEKQVRRIAGNAAQKNS